MAKRVVIIRKAYLDIDRIINFNNKRNKTDAYSKKITQRLFNKFMELSLTPFLGIKTNKPGSMVLIWSQFHIFYNVESDVIVINSVYHQKENAEI